MAKRRQSERSKRAFLQRLGADLAKTSLSQDSPSQTFYSTTEVRSWGSGAHGQLGLGDDRHRMQPEILSCSEHFTVAVNDEGHTYIWGRPPLEHSTANIKVPERVTGLDGIAVRTIASGPDHVAVACSAGMVYSWGKGAGGRLGHGDEHSLALPKRVQHIPTSTPITQVACGEEHTLLLDAKGSVFSCGSNRAGQLGTGSYAASTEPLAVATSTRFIAIVCGRNHSGAIGLDHTVFTWGWGEKGRLGLGSEESVTRPTRVEGLKDVRKLSFGGAHSLALTAGKKACRHSRGFSLLGLGHWNDSNVPKVLRSLADIDQIATGFGHSAAVSATGDLFVWGFGEEGQLGTGDEGNRNTPQQVWTGRGSAVDPPRILQVSLGKLHSIAVAQLSMSATQRARLSPENLRRAATCIQRFVRTYLARAVVRRQMVICAEHRGLEHEERVRQLQYEREIALERQHQVRQEIAQRAKEEEERCLALQALAAAKRERQQHEQRATMATRLQAFLRGVCARADYAVRRQAAQNAKADEAETQRMAARDCFAAASLLAFTDSERDRLASELIERIHAEALASASDLAHATMAACLVHEEAERQSFEAQRNEAAARAERVEQEKRLREARRIEAQALADAAHRQRRDKEIAEAKARVKQRLLAASAVSSPTPPKKDKRKLKESQLKRIADALNANRSERDKLRLELAEQKRQQEVREQEKALAAAKAEAERHDRLFRKSQSCAPPVRASLSSSIRALHIAETYRVLPGEVKPHYVLDCEDPATPMESDSSRSTSKHRIFRELAPRRSLSSSVSGASPTNQHR
ncbi:E3 ubiquitin-protein ligase HERC1-like [Achlya hypogyna]|uniref:E3 ubiquitin-protein ligase HERC1-like n=1 Tax=Achlya hypogyna TaxID=1202772 RepID=A0A1V9Z4I9_ACHHY|nr:E3 ubiquitin-protein ligase HERC1-like [Achlya hypogyna]